MPTYLYTVETLVTLFGKVDEYHNELGQLFNIMVGKTYEHFKEMQVQDMKKVDPDLVEDYFGMITRFLRHLPTVVFNSPFLVLSLNLDTNLGLGNMVYWTKYAQRFKGCLPVLGRSNEALQRIHHRKRLPTAKKSGD